MLDQYDLVDSKRTEDGLLESTWDRPDWEWQAKFYFDPKQGNRPVKAVHFGEQPVDESEDRPIQSLHTIKWQKWQLSREKSVWVPIFFRRHTIDRINHSESELECYLTWRDTTKETVIPSVSDLDWREPIRAIVDEDWTLDYDDWLRSRGDGYSFVQNAE